MKILHRYLFTQIAVASASSISVLTLVLILVGAFKKVANLLVENEVPLLLILKMLGLMLPEILIYTIPWGLLFAVLLVFGRMSHDLEIQSVRASGLGLIPFVSPVILLSIGMTLFAFYNNAILAPQCKKAFKLTLINMGKNNPTVFLKAQEPLDKFDGMRIYIDGKDGNRVHGIYIWDLDEEGIPKKSLRADQGILAADLNDLVLKITLFNTRGEERPGKNAKDINSIRPTMKAETLPREVPLKEFLNTEKIDNNISVKTFRDLTNKLLSPNITDFNVTPVVTELQKRLVFAVACFTFTLIGIPLAITIHRRETSIGFVLSLGVGVTFFLLVLVAESLKNKSGAYPEVIIWVPNLLFQAIGFWLLWKLNKHPA